MNFTVSANTAPQSGPLNTAWLQKDGWDDFGFKTMFKLTVYGSQGEPYVVGDVKIGEVGQVSGRPAIPSEFERLNKHFFSLGQDVSYYVTLTQMPPELREALLRDLNDTAADRGLFDRVRSENVYQTSLLRYVQAVTVRRQFARVLKGEASLTSFHFEYCSVNSTIAGQLKLTFKVRPESVPPTNLHVLVGSNGVGKTHHITQMRDSRTFRPIEHGVSDIERDNDNHEQENYFAQIVALSVSAFDNQELASVNQNRKDGISVKVVNIAQPDDAGNVDGASRLSLMRSAFVVAAMSAMNGARRERFQEALQILMSDTVFEQSGVLSVVKSTQAMPGESQFERVFDQLSAGHRAVLIALTNLVLHVEERTLVLIDEPETHLHPPLLSAFVRAVSNLMASRNGVAIIATHSPVVLQEVPKACVWKLRRSGEFSVAQRPQIETFGENVGILTHEVFGLEVTSAGFYRMISELVEAGRSYSDIIEGFDEQLGSEARAIVSSLVAVRDHTLS